MIRSPYPLMIFFFLGILFCMEANAQPCAQGGCPAGYCIKQVNITMPDPCNPAITRSVVVDFCYPSPTSGIGPRQVFIKTIYYNSPCGWMDPDVMMNIHLALLSDTSVVNCSLTVGCDEWCQDNPTCVCPGAYAEWTVSSGSCLTNVGTGNNREWEACGSDTCISVFQICCLNGEPNPRWMATAPHNSGNCGGPGCSPICPTRDAGLTCCELNGDPIGRCPDSTCPHQLTLECDTLERSKSSGEPSLSETRMEPHGAIGNTGSGRKEENKENSPFDTSVLPGRLNNEE